MNTSLRLVGAESVRRSPSLIASFASCTLAALAATTGFGQQSFSKFIIFAGVDAGAKIEGGALVETWAGPKQKDDAKVNFYPGKSYFFTRADPTNTATANLNGATLDQIVKPVAGVNVAFGPSTMGLWQPSKITADDSTTHTQGNNATARIAVFSEPALATTQNVPGDGVKPLVLANAVTATIDVTATAGAPTDGDKFHSADAWAGVYVENAKTFIKQTGTPGPFTLLGGNKVAYVGVDDPTGAKAKKYVDPWDFTIDDLTSGTSFTSQLLTQTITINGANLTIDDTGIQLTVNKLNPLSSVSIDFNSQTPWVANPYRYSITLNNSGLSLDGSVFPSSGWTITSTPSLTQATYAFGTGGLPLDLVNVAPPESVFTTGHTYSYSVSDTNGTYGIASVPDTTSTLVLLFGATSILAAFRRLRRTGP